MVAAAAFLSAGEAHAAESTQAAEPALSQTSIRVVAGETRQLSVSGISGTIAWTSADPAIAEVDADGTVTGRSYGNTVITAQAGTVRLTCSVRVLDPKTDRSSVCLAVGDSLDVDTLQYSGKVQWTSQDPGIAEVGTYGRITAVSPGNTIVTVRANGVDVNVSVRVVSVTLSQTSLYLKTGQSAQLTVTGTGTDGTWSSSDTSRLTVNADGTCVANTPGWATAIYTIGDSQRSCTVRIADSSVADAFSRKIRQSSSGIRSLRTVALGKNSRYRFLQGSCTTGKYGYFLLGDKNYRPYCALVKVRLSDWKVMKVRRHLKLYHGNDMAYDSKRRLLVVAHGTGDPTGLSLISTSTLKIVNNFHIDSSIYGVAYSSEHDLFVTASGDNIQIRDRNWNIVQTFRIADRSGYTWQGIDCENSCIYVLQSRLQKKMTRILIYSWDGVELHTSYLKGALEAESLFHSGERFIISYNTGSYRGGKVYETALRKYYIVRYSPGTGKGKAVVSVAGVGSTLRVKRCGYRKKGYRFAGWTITRRSTRTTLCRNRKTGKYRWLKLSSLGSKSNWKPYRIRGGRKISALTSDAGDCVVLTAQWTKRSR